MRTVPIGLSVFVQHFVSRSVTVRDAVPEINGAAMARSIEDTTLETAVRLSFFVNPAKSATAASALFDAMDNHDSIETVAADVNSSLDTASPLHVGSRANTWQEVRLLCLTALEQVRVPVSKVAVDSVIDEITDDDLFIITNEFDELSSAQRSLLAGEDILNRLLGWIEQGTDASEGETASRAAISVLAKQPNGDWPSRVAETISVLAARNTYEGSKTAGHLLAGLKAIASERRFGLECSITESHVLDHIEHSFYEVNHAALQALTTIGDPISAEATDKLLTMSIEAASSERDGGWWASAVVEALASVEDSPQLRDLVRRFLDHDQRVAQYSAATTLAKLGGREEAKPLWNRFMKQRSIYDRMFAEKLINEFATEDDVEEAAAMLAKRLNKTTKTNFAPTPQAGNLIQFLSRYPDNADATTALNNVTTQFDQLAESLQSWIQRSFPELAPSTTT